MLVRIADKRNRNGASSEIAREWNREQRIWIIGHREPRPRGKMANTVAYRHDGLPDRGLRHACSWRSNDNRTHLHIASRKGISNHEARQAFEYR